MSNLGEERVGDQASGSGGSLLGSRPVRQGRRSTQPEQRADVLIITALKEEFDEACRVEEGSIGQWETQEVRGFPVAYRTFRGMCGGHLRIAMSWSALMRSIAVAAMAERLMGETKPRCLAMSGVCAGRRGAVQRGDVIIAKLLYNYEAGGTVIKYDESSSGSLTQRRDPDAIPFSTKLLHRAQDFRTRIASAFMTAAWLRERPRTLEDQGNWILAQIHKGSDPDQHPDSEANVPDWKDALNRLWKLGFLADNLNLTETGRNYIHKVLLSNRQKLPQPEPWGVHIAPIATGSNVMRDERIFDKLSSSMREVLGVEMEAHAIGRVAETEGIPWVVMKGVMDHADIDKDDKLKRFSARASAECLIRFLRDVPEFCQSAPVAEVTARAETDLSMTRPPTRSDIPAEPIDDTDTLPEVGRPTAGVRLLSIVPGLLADRIGTGASQPSFDLGTAWGVSRGRTLGLVAGFKGALIFETLIAIEEIVWNACRQKQEEEEQEKTKRQETCMLPARFWFRLRFDNVLIMPSDAEALYQLLKAHDESGRSARLAEAGWPTNVLLGIVLEVPTADGEDSEKLNQSILAWVLRLARIGERRPIDIVVDFQRHSRIALGQAVERLQAMVIKEGLTEVIAMNLRRSPVNDAAIKIERSVEDPLLRLLPESEAARMNSDISRWYSLALARWCAASATIHEKSGITEQYSKVVNHIVRLRIQPNPNCVPGSASKLLNQLNQDESLDSDFDFQLLGFFDLLLPDYVPLLLEAYAKGVRPKGERAALQFASRSNEYADAFAAGAFSNDRFPSVRSFSDTRDRGIRVLGAIHRQSLGRPQHPLPEAVKAHIELLGLGDVLSSITADDEVDAAVIWRILVEPVTPECVEAVLRSSLTVRAALGLISERAWGEIVRDEYRFRRVLEMRTGIGLPFAESRASAEGGLE